LSRVHFLSEIFTLLRWLRLGLAACMMFFCIFLSAPAQADAAQLAVFEVERSEEGLLLNFSSKFELSSVVQDAIQKGVPLVFVAQARVLANRWYWLDKPINTTTRSWRLSYQPLTQKYRVGFAGLAHNFDSLPEALGALSSSARWKLANASELNTKGLYIEFHYELDTTQLPRPMQMGINGQDEWQLRVERTQKIP
jgi:Domain of unknown function (DUF4390)